MTGLRTCTRGSSFVNERPIAGHRISGVNSDFERAASRPARVAGAVSVAVIGVEGQVELGGVDARLAEQAEGAAVGVVVDELRRRGRAGARARAATRRAWIAALASEMCGSTPEAGRRDGVGGTSAFVSPGLYGR